MMLSLTLNLKYNFNWLHTKYLTLLCMGFFRRFASSNRRTKSTNPAAVNLAGFLEHQHPRRFPATYSTTQCRHQFKKLCLFVNFRNRFFGLLKAVVCLWC